MGRACARWTAAALCLLMLSLCALQGKAAVPDYEMTITYGLLEAFDANNDAVALDAAADWSSDLKKILEGVGVLLPRSFEIEMQGDMRFVTFRCRYQDPFRFDEYYRLGEIALEQLLRPGMSDREKVVAMHDWLAYNTSYDFAAAKATNYLRYINAFSPAGPLVDGKAVCDGYSRTLMLFCRMQGIPCLRISSRKMGHSYNAVWLDGEWLLVDVTWDDSGADGTLLYDYLLKKPSEMTTHSADDGSEHTWSYSDIIGLGERYYARWISSKQFGAPLGEITQQELAEQLRKSGLFRGTDRGLELAKTPSRAEIAVLFTRLLGREQQALTATADAPFSDMPAWAGHHISQLYRDRLISGVGGGMFGSAIQGTERDYSTLLLRALGYREGVDFTWTHATDAARKLGLAASLGAPTGFTRGDVVEMTVRALYTQRRDSEQTLGEYLMETYGMARTAADPLGRMQEREQAAG